MHKVFSIFISTAVVLASMLAPFHALALSGSDFKAGRIIDDAIFFKGDDMSADQVQQFLNDKVPTCDTNGTQAYNSTMTRAQFGATRNNPAPFVCLKDYRIDVPAVAESQGLCQAITAGNKSAAQIIQEVGASCGINQKVLLALLQTEQSLVTDVWPFTNLYQNAMGYGCPDASPCDARFAGFFNQVYGAAQQFKMYQAHSQTYSIHAYQSNDIRYNPNSACGSASIYVENQATAGLYNYHPYQPNVAALNNLNGSGDGCSSYSNRNFWRYYNEWFGSTLATAPKPTAQILVDGKTTAVFPYGSDVTLAWSSTNASNCTLLPDNISGTSATSTLIEVTKPQAYSLTCNDQSGNTVKANASFTVSPPTFQYLRDYITRAFKVSHGNQANLSSIMHKLNRAEKEFNAGKKAQAQKTVESTILAVNRLPSKHKLYGQSAEFYTTAANALIASWTPVVAPPAPIPPVIVPPVAIINGGYPSKWADVEQDSVIDDWGMYNRECVSYTAFKVAQSGRHMPYWGGVNANHWDEMALESGIPVDATPVVGDVAIYNGGAYGHSMYVEAINADGTINVSQYNASLDGRYSVRSNVPVSNLVFIHFPY